MLTKETYYIKGKVYITPDDSVVVILKLKLKIVLMSS